VYGIARVQRCDYAWLVCVDPDGCPIKVDCTLYRALELARVLNAADREYGFHELRLPHLDYDEFMRCIYKEIATAVGGAPTYLSTF